MASLLITAEQLQPKLNQQNLRLIDVRSYEDYTRSHILGATHFDMVDFNARLAGTPHATVGLLPTIEDFNKTAARTGINAEQTVVVYDESAGPPAARFAWTLKTFGHNHVSMLVGGFQHWLNAGFAINTAILSVALGAFKGELQTDRIANRHYILSKCDNKDICIVDARTTAEFQGEDLRARRGGHIPGAVNVNWTSMKDTDQITAFKSPDELQQLFESQGITKDKEIICYCQSHQRSAVLCLLLEELGYPMVKGYPGAWSDWGNQTDTPIAN